MPTRLPGLSGQTVAELDAGGVSQFFFIKPWLPIEKNCAYFDWGFFRSAPPGDTSSNVKSEADANNRNNQQWVSYHYDDSPEAFVDWMAMIVS